MLLLSLLLVRKLVLLKPVARDFCNCLITELIPTSFQAESPNRTPKYTKGTCSMNGICQLLPYSFATLRSRKFIHNGPFMNVETVRQLEETIAFQCGANLGQHLTLPFGNIFQRFPFHQMPLLFCYRDDLACFWVQVGSAVFVCCLHRLDDFAERNDSRHVVLHLRSRK